MSMMKSG